MNNSTSHSPIKRFVVSDGQRPANVDTLYCYEPRSVVLSQIAASSIFMTQNIADVNIAAPGGALTSIAPGAAGTAPQTESAYPGFVEEYSFAFQGATNVQNSFVYRTPRGNVTGDTARVTVRSNAGSCSTECDDGTLTLFSIAGNVINNRFYYSPALINQTQAIGGNTVKNAQSFVNNLTVAANTVSTVQRIPTPQQNEGLYQLWYMTFFGINLGENRNG